MRTIQENDGADMTGWNRDGLAAWNEHKRHCRDVYDGGCGIFIGPPDWSHRIDRYRGGSHPTHEQALAAAQNPDTDPFVLQHLGDWDAEVSRGVREAARANPSHPRVAS